MFTTLEVTGSYLHRHKLCSDIHNDFQCDYTNKYGSSILQEAEGLALQLFDLNSHNALRMRSV
jgi:hypothetical protein